MLFVTGHARQIEGHLTLYSRCIHGTKTKFPHPVASQDLRPRPLSKPFGHLQSQTDARYMSSTDHRRELVLHLRYAARYLRHRECVCVCVCACIHIAPLPHTYAGAELKANLNRRECEYGRVKPLRNPVSAASALAWFCWLPPMLRLRWSLLLPGDRRRATSRNPG